MIYLALNAVVFCSCVTTLLEFVPMLREKPQIYFRNFNNWFISEFFFRAKMHKNTHWFEFLFWFKLKYFLAVRQKKKKKEKIKNNLKMAIKALENVQISFYCCLTVDRPTNWGNHRLIIMKVGSCSPDYIILEINWWRTLDTSVY